MGSSSTPAAQRGTPWSSFSMKQNIGFAEAVKTGQCSKVVPKLNKRFDVKAMKMAKQFGKDDKYININPPKPKEES